MLVKTLAHLDSHGWQSRKAGVELPDEAAGARSHSALLFLPRSEGRGKTLGTVATSAKSLASLPRALARGLESEDDLGVLTPSTSLWSSAKQIDKGPLSGPSAPLMLGRAWVPQ